MSPLGIFFIPLLMPQVNRILKRTVLSVILAVVSIILHAQEEMTVSSFDADLLSLEAKLHPRTDLNGKAGSLICISITSSDVEFAGSILGVPEYDKGEWKVYVSADSRDLQISVKGYHPYMFEFPASLEPYRTYRMKVTIPVKEKFRSLVLPSISFGTSQTSYGMMVGFARKFGGYLRAKSDLVFDLSTSGECDGEGQVGAHKAWLTGESKRSRYAFTGGGIFRVAKHLYLYVGAGYGQRILAWETQSGEYLGVIDDTYKGVEAETGFILRLGVFTLSSGVQTNQFKYLEANAGIGVMF